MAIRSNKTLKRALAAIIGLFVLLSAFYFFWLSPQYTVPILTYHDFGYEKGIRISPENFESQMRYLKNKGYNVISLDVLVEGIKNEKKFTHNTVVITMDDGYKDNFTCAYPVLKKYGFPATIFLIANNIGTDANFLNWDEIKDMGKNNIFFGAHTKNHVYLPAVEKKDILWDEIAGCKELIQRHIGMPVDYFSYPSGGFTEEVKIIVKKAGYKGACTTNRGFDKDTYELRRISVRNSDNAFSLWAKLSGYYNLLRKRKSGD